MSINAFVASAAIAVALTGTIAGACKHPRARGTLKTSATPNNSVSNSTAISPKFKAEAKRGLGVVLAA
jgi:hypothetical protein